MNTGKTLTVFVRRDKSAFIASVGLSEYTSVVSSTVAAQMAAAHAFGVPRERIDLLPTGPHTLIASVKRTGNAFAWDLLAFGVTMAATAAICWTIWKGGAL